MEVENKHMEKSLWITLIRDSSMFDIMDKL